MEDEIEIDDFDDPVDLSIPVTVIPDVVIDDRANSTHVQETRKDHSYSNIFPEHSYTDEDDVDDGEVTSQESGDDDNFNEKWRQKQMNVSKKKNKIKLKDDNKVQPEKHNYRWSQDEDDRLKEAISIYSYGNWEFISEFVGTRTAMQCKNRNGYLLANSEEKSNTSNSVLLPLTVEFSNKAQDIKEETSDSSVINNNNQPEHHPQNILSFNKKSSSSHISSSALLSELLSEPLGSDFKSLKSFSKPQEFVLRLEKIHPFEVYHNGEWFPDIEHPYYIHKRLNINKTPARYIKIRNHVFNLWESNKPKFVTKTSIRKGLKGEGDVHALSRVWEFLVNHDIINIGFEKVDKMENQKNNRQNLEHDQSALVEMDFKSLQYGLTSEKRKRRIRGINGNWIDESEAEGQVIDHTAIHSDMLHEKPKIKRKRVFNRDGDLYDPFRLVAPKRYSAENPPPFQVSISCNALALVDFHSHLAYTEVIGLLGGKFDKTSQELLIEDAFPCKSISTTMQCEMDPVSEMEARDYFLEKDYQIVGWYHSHPTFDPNPSIRDIETQCTYQSLFRLDDGFEPFVGVIINPYPPESQTEFSEIKVVSMSHEVDAKSSHRRPYNCLLSLCESVDTVTMLQERLIKLLLEYKSHEHKVDLNEVYMIEENEETINKDPMERLAESSLKAEDMENMKCQVKTITKLDKALTSIQSHLNGFFNEDKVNELANCLRSAYLD